MLDANQVKARLANALAGYESFRAFADWLYKESASLRFEDEDLLNLVDSILNPLQVYFDNLISESRLRNELRVFASDQIQSATLRFTFDDSRADTEIPAQSVKTVPQPTANSPIHHEVRFAT